MKESASKKRGLGNVWTDENKTSAKIQTPLGKKTFDISRKLSSLLLLSLILFISLDVSVLTSHADIRILRKKEITSAGNYTRGVKKTCAEWTFKDIIIERPSLSFSFFHKKVTLCYVLPTIRLLGSILYCSPIILNFFFLDTTREEGVKRNVARDQTERTESDYTHTKPLFFFCKIFLFIFSSYLLAATSSSFVSRV